MRHALFAALLVLPFLSKVSLRFIPGVPESESVWWLQGGIHPVVNSVVSGGLLFAAALWYFPRQPQSRTERAYLSGCVLLLVILWTQTVFQLAFDQLEGPWWIHLSGLILTTLLVFGYGWLVPASVETESVFKILLYVTRGLLVLSLIALVVSSGTSFKGSRFIGVFKQIPYMVTCAQLSMLAEAQNFSENRMSSRLLSGVFVFLAMGVLVLTGTRSGVLCALLFLALAAWKFPRRDTKARWARAFAVYVGAIFAVTLGPFAVMELKGLLRGQSSFALRSAQDGVSSRIEEVQRGMLALSEHPWLGHGIMHRFTSNSLESAGRYSSFRDPHNVLASAGVIGGWPFIVFIAAAGLVALLILLKGYRTYVDSNEQYRVVLVAAYLLSHVPILFIYHIHLSLGGLADRMYWFLFGVVCCADGPGTLKSAPLRGNV